MRQCFLHIGPPKTGSSTLQHFLFENRTLLATAGFYVPAGDRDNEKGNHAHLSREMARAASPGNGATLAAELRKQGLPDCVILSSESYAGLIRQRKFRDWVVNYFAALGYRVTVMAYIRPQVALINSSYTSLAKSLRPMPPFGVYFKKWLSECAARNFATRFAPLLTESRMDIQFIPFTSALTKRGLCEEFMTRIGAGPVLADCGPAQLRNESQGPKTIAAMQSIRNAVKNIVVSAPADTLNALASQLRQIAAAKGWNASKFDGLHPADKDRLIAIYANSNEEFSKLAWNASWRGIFAADEDAIRTRPRNIFEVDQCAPEERADFEDYCGEAVSFIEDFLARR